MIKGYENIDTWIFDLDDTLYPRGSDWIEKMFKIFYEHIQEFYGLSEEEAIKIDKEIDKKGFYLEGWMEHLPNFDVQHWWEVMDSVDSCNIPICTLTQKKLQELPGNKILFTNGHPNHATKLLKHLGLTNHFDEIITIGMNEIKLEQYKPNPSMYQKIIANMETTAENCAMFEDNLLNLKTAHDLGMKTVLVNQPEDHTHLPHVHCQRDTFTHWLEDYMITSA